MDEKIRIRKEKEVGKQENETVKQQSKKKKEKGRKNKMLRTRTRVPLRGALGIIRRSNDSKKWRSASERGRWVTVRTWMRSIPVWVRFDKSQGGYQMVETYEGWRP